MLHSLGFIMMLDPSTIPSVSLSVARSYLEENNIKPDVLYQKLGVNQELCNDSVGLIPLECFLKTLKLIQEVRRDDEPLCNIIRRLLPFHITGSALSQTAFSAPNLQLGLELLQTFLSMATPVSLSFYHDNEVAYVKLSGFELFQEFEDAMTEACYLKIQDYIAFYTGVSNTAILMLENSGSEPHLMKFFTAEIKPNCQVTQLVLSAEFLKSRSPISDQDLYEKRLARFQSMTHGNREFSYAVKKVVSDYLEKGNKVSFQILADQLSMSERKLSRALKAEGNSFQKIMDACISIRGQELLLEGKQLKSIAIDLGFKTVTGFNQAYVRHYGVSPKDFKHKSKVIGVFGKSDA